MTNIELKILNKIVNLLKNFGYNKIQYIPTSFSFLAIIKEYQNIFNFFFKKRHLLFYYSLFPQLYFFFLNKELQTLYKIFYKNLPVPHKMLKRYLGSKDIKNLVKLKIVKKKQDNYKFNLSFVPFRDFIFIRDSHDIYEKFFDPKKIKNKKVWMGADSIMFLRFLEDYLKKYSFRSAFEIGSGTGIVIGSISNKFEKCEAIDVSERAVKFTKINAKINNFLNLKSYKSDLYKNVKKKFDLIIANPWFVDLKHGGLEEAPKIIKKLDKYLNKNGRCLLIMNSYIKKNNDTLLDYFSNILKKNNFDVNLYSNGANYEFNRTKDYKKFNINYVLSYNVEIIIDGSGILTKYEAPFLRRLRDFMLKIVIKFI